eukprot:384303_1
MEAWAIACLVLACVFLLVGLLICLYMIIFARDKFDPVLELFGLQGPKPSVQHHQAGRSAVVDSSSDDEAPSYRMMTKKGKSKEPEPIPPKGVAGKKKALADDDEDSEEDSEEEAPVKKPAPKPSAQKKNLADDDDDDDEDTDD